MEELKQEVKPQTETDFRRVGDFSDKFANNVFLEPTAWDLKLVFGQVDIHISANTVVQHTGITLPWAQVKVINYFLSLHVASHEAQFGRLVVPSGAVGQLPEPSEADIKQFPQAMELYRVVSKIREKFVTENPESEAAKPETN